MVDVTQRSGKYSRNVQVVVGSDSVDIIRSPSIFMDLVSILVDTNAIESRTTNDYEPYDIENKIDFNDIIKHRERIEGFYLYSSMIDNAYETLNEIMPAAKETALKNINSRYLDCQGDLLLKNREAYKLCENTHERNNLKIRLVREFADWIIDCVIEHIIKKCQSSLMAMNYTSEEIECHASFIVYHAFVECKILEKPI
ncbi:ABC-three component system protein [Cronobacter sakazakii]|uniref:ABC-three component system protein n=1 Tax=Cronobacter sakazakii TaxID=28141 RepID=UPI000CFCACD3|nr:ABC-three component system protein [Cronobacter sakazakii]